MVNGNDGYKTLPKTDLTSSNLELLNFRVIIKKAHEEEENEEIKSFSKKGIGRGIRIEFAKVILMRFFAPTSARVPCTFLFLGIR